MKAWALCAGLVGLLAGGLAGQDISGFERPVKARQYVAYVAEAQNVPAGKRAVLELRFQVSEGFHVGSHRPGSEYSIATRLELLPGAGVRVGEAEYPDGKPLRVAGETLNVYANAFMVQVPMTAAAGDHALDGKLTYQACDRAACYPPKTLSLRVLFSAK